MSRITDIERRGVYTDVLRRFRSEGWGVYIVTPHERSLGMPTELVEKNGVQILGVKTLNLQKTSAIEKGIGQVTIESLYEKAIKKFFKGTHFDLILYSTPPITFPNVIQYLKAVNPQAKTYLLLKDIFPQNAVDLGMMPGASFKFQVSSFKSWVDLGKYQLYKMFRRKEKRLYALSDYIGCMSPANVDYVLKHNPEIAPDRVEVAPNSVELSPAHSTGSIDKVAVRQKHGLPGEKPVFIYGGNLGKPQGIPFLIKCLDANANRKDCYFVVVGTGTELPKLKQWYNERKPQSVKVMDGLPRQEYEELANSCDVGLIFLDHKFTIPNYPSRLLPYLMTKKPILAATDPICDTGKIAEENGYGLWCESNSVEGFTSAVDKMLKSNLREMGERGYDFLCKNYLVDNTYQAIVKHV